MNSSISFGRIKAGNTVEYQDKKGRFDFAVREQAGQQVYLDRSGRRLGYIDSQGRTWSADNRLLNSQTRPDLILGNRPRRP